MSRRGNASRLVACAGLALLVSLGGGCSDRGKSSPASSAEKSGAQRAHSRAVARERRAAARRARSRERDASRRAAVPPAHVTLGEGDAVTHRVVKAGESLDEASDQPVRVELAQAGQVQLRPGARARLGSVAPAQVILSAGSASMDRPGGMIGQPPLRVATPVVTVVIPAMGQAEVAALPDGRTWVGAVSGQVELETGRAGPDGRVQRRPLPAGRQALVAIGKVPADVSPMLPAAGKAKRAPPGSELSAKAASQAKAMMRSVEPAAPETVARISKQAVSALDALLRDVKAERDAGRVLAGALEHMVSADPDRARGLRRKIVAHSTALLHLHWRLLPLWERAAADGDWMAWRTGTKQGADLQDRTSRVQAELLRQP